MQNIQEYAISEKYTRNWLSDYLEIWLPDKHDC